MNYNTPISPCHSSSSAASSAKQDCQGKNSPAVWHLSPLSFLFSSTKLSTSKTCSLQCGGSPKQKIWLSPFLKWNIQSCWSPAQLRLMAFPCLLAGQNPAGRVSAELREMSKDLLAHLAGTINPQTAHLTWQIYYKHTQNPVGKQVHKDFKAKLLPDQLTNVLVSFHAQDQGELPVVRMNAYK